MSVGAGTAKTNGSKTLENVVKNTVEDTRVERIVEQWNSGQSNYLRIRPQDVHWNLTHQKLIRYELVSVSEVPCIVGCVTQAAESEGISQNTLWLSLWGKILESDVGKFVDELSDLARRRGKSRVCIGGEEFHFVPGVPVLPANEPLRTALSQRGFKLSREVDLVGSLRNSAVAQYISEGIAKNVAGEFHSHIAVSRLDHQRIGDFMAKEFPGRWSREFAFWRHLESNHRAKWLMLYAKGVLAGFARVAFRGLNDQGRWMPGALRLPLDGVGWNVTDCCLGPIGVAKDLRGTGVGKILLAHVLEQLRASGGELVCIDWTDAIQYYRPLGFTEVRAYDCASASL